MGALLGDCVKAIETRIRRRKTALAWLETTEAAETKFAGLLRRKLKGLAGTCKAAGRGGEQTCSYKHILGTRGNMALSVGGVVLSLIVRSTARPATQTDMGGEGARTVLVPALEARPFVRCRSSVSHAREDLVDG